MFYNIQCSPQGTQQCNISISAIKGGSYTDWTRTYGTQQCTHNISRSAIDTPQSANHYSMTQGQVNTLQAFSVQLIVISVQQFYGVIPVNSKGQAQ